MRRRRLGTNGPEISVIGYGAWEIGGNHWGPNPPEGEIFAAMRTAFEAGMTWVDTAEVYGKGVSEELCGRALRDHPDVLVFTKVAPKPAGTGFAPDEVRAACEASLKRLGRDAIDLYQLHWPDETSPVEETWEAMASLVDDGLVRWIGVSNFSRELIERCERIRHVDSLQPPFSLLRPGGRDDLFPFCAENGTGVIAYGPLAYGLLTGAITAQTEFHPGDWRSGTMGMRAYETLFAPAAREEKLAIVDGLRPIAARLGISLAQLALGWVLAQRGVTGAIAGSRSPRHNTENARGGDVELSRADIDEVERVAGL